MSEEKTGVGYTAGRLVRRLFNAIPAHSTAFALLAASVIGVIAFRFEYIPRESGGQGIYLLRVDRVTGHICYIVEAAQARPFVDRLLTFPECRF